MLQIYFLLFVANFPGMRAISIHDPVLKNFNGYSFKSFVSWSVCPLQLFQFCLIYASKERAYPSKAPFRSSFLGRLLTLPTNIRLGCKGLLVYYEHLHLTIFGTSIRAYIGKFCESYELFSLSWVQQISRSKLTWLSMTILLKHSSLIVKIMKTIFYLWHLSWMLQASFFLTDTKSKVGVIVINDPFQHSSLWMNIIIKIFLTL